LVVRADRRELFRGDFHADQAHVVAEFFAGTVGAKFVEDFVEDFGEGLFAAFFEFGSDKIRLAIAKKG
jgi:hypothetical protein